MRRFNWHPRDGGGWGEDRGWRRQPVLTEVIFSTELAEVAPQVLPQIVPESLCLASGKSIVSLPLVDGLRIAMVLDQPRRYTYISQATMKRWGARETTLLALALRNLREISAGLEWKRIGLPPREILLCETFDGYDASRVLLLAEFEHLFGHLTGSVVVGLPHRDYLVVASDAEPGHVAQLEATVASDYREARYPVSPRLFCFDRGELRLYAGPQTEVPPEPH